MVLTCARLGRQSNAKSATSQGSSCGASDRDEGGAGAAAVGDWVADGGEWDVSGTPNNYNFTVRPLPPAGNPPPTPCSFGWSCYAILPRSLFLILLFAALCAQRV